MLAVVVVVVVAVVVAVLVVVVTIDGRTLRCLNVEFRVSVVLKETWSSAGTFEVSLQMVWDEILTQDDKNLDLGWWYCT